MKTIPDFQKRKASGEPITMVTCYDAATAKILNGTSVDSLLVGDSLAMVVHGFDSTVHATVEMMALHTAAVRRGAPDKAIVADLPFLAHRKGPDSVIDSVAALMRAGANAVKIERCRGNLNVIGGLIDAGVPVMGHLGLTPQSVNAFGGYKVQAKTDEAARTLLREAKELESAGCFALLLECVPAEVAERVTESLTIPTIGIGCGPATSGQVLVINDLLGMDAQFCPSFARQYLDGARSIGEAVDLYCRDVRARTFPAVGEYTELRKRAIAGA